MRLVTQRPVSQHLPMAPLAGSPVLFEHNSLIVSQISKKDSDIGMVNASGVSFKSIQCQNGRLVLSIYPITLPGQISMDLLNFISMSVAIVEISPGTTTSSEVSRAFMSADTLALGNTLFATNGRLSFDLSKYPICMVRLLYSNHTRERFNLKIEEFYYEQ